MTKLETLYASIKGLQDLGLPLNEETLKAADELEEQLIKTEILPAMSKNIEPILSKIHRDLVLVIEYNPNQPLSVRISRKMNIAKTLEAKIIESDSVSTAKRTRGAYTGLCITCPDGTIINEPLAKDTLCKAINIVGLEKAMTVFNGTFFTDEKHIKRSFDQVELAPGIYLNVNNNNQRKAHYLETLSEKYKLGWKIEVIK